MTNICPSTCSTAEACKLLDKQRKFGRCDVESGVLTSAEGDCTIAFASQILDPKFDFSGSGEVRGTAKCFMNKKAQLLAIKNPTG